VFGETRLGSILGSGRISVNSYHHQAVDAVAPGFTIVARTEDSVVEAIERDDGAFCIGVQLHPEIMAHRDERMMAIFNEFVEARR